MTHVTTYAELLNALAVVRDRANADGLPSHMRAVRMWRATDALWNDEYATWEALTKLGHHRAADCAWKRRTVYSDLAILLLKGAV